MLEFSAGISQTWAEKASGPGFGKSRTALNWRTLSLSILCRAPWPWVEYWTNKLILEGGMHIGGWNH